VAPKPYIARVAVALLLIIVASGPRARAGSLPYDLQLAAFASPDTVISGGQVTLVLRASNDGPGIPTDTTFDLDTPAGTTFESLAGDVTVLQAPDPGGTGPIQCVYPGPHDIGVVLELDIVFNVVADPGQDVTFDASVSATDPAFEADPSNNAATVVVPVIAGSATSYDLSLAAAADPNPAQPGGLVTLALTAVNAGPDPAVDVTFSLATPEGTTFDSIPTESVTVLEAPDPGGSGPVRFVVAGPLDIGQTLDVAVVFNVTAGPGAQLLFDASVAANDPDLDVEPANNAASLVVTVPTVDAVADVAVEFQQFADSAAAGAPYAFAVSVSNLSATDTASGVALTVPLPIGTRLASVSDVDGVCAAPAPGTRGDVVCVFAEIAPGESLTVEIEVAVDARAGTVLVVEASAAAASTDPDPSNNAASIQFSVLANDPTTLDWDEPDPASTARFPPPRNLIVTTAPGTRPRPARVRRAELLGYNVYASAQPNVVPSAGSLITSVPPTTTSATVPAAPSGTFFVVTAVYDGGESGASNEASADVPAATVTAVVVKPTKIVATGTSFTATVEVFVDGIPFVRPAKVKSGLTRVVQKGALLTGQTVGAYLAAHPSVLLTFRNSNGGVAAFPYPANR
jgi:uncharacterized repeat protein (TIGR01451 family)